MIRLPALGSACFAALVIGATPAGAQGFAGTWVNDQPTNTSQIRLVLVEHDGGRIGGTLTGAGTTVPIEGAVKDAMLTGRVEWTTGTVLLEAELVEDGLELLLISPRADGTPDYTQSSAIEFVREGTGVPASVERSPDSAGTTNIDGDPVASSPLARRWAAHLIGKKLTQLESYGGSDGGYSRRRELLLCSDGRFQYRESNSVSADVGGVFGGGSGGDAGTGQWRIRSQGQLVGIDMRFSDGRHWQVPLEERNGSTYVSGERTYVTPGEGCP